MTKSITEKLKQLSPRRLATLFWTSIIALSILSIAIFSTYGNPETISEVLLLVMAAVQSAYIIYVFCLLTFAKFTCGDGVERRHIVIMYKMIVENFDPDAEETKRKDSQ